MVTFTLYLFQNWPSCGEEGGWTTPGIDQEAWEASTIAAIETKTTPTTLTKIWDQLLVEDEGTVRDKSMAEDKHFDGKEDYKAKGIRTTGGEDVSQGSGKALRVGEQGT